MKDQQEEPKKPVDQPHVNAIAALTSFVSKYEPATIETADTFFTTNEISAAIEAHTGKRLGAQEIYQVMSQMQYTYEAVNGLEFNWLLRKESYFLHCPLN